MHSPTALPRVYRLQRWYLLVGLAGIVFYTALAFGWFAEAANSRYSEAQMALLVGIILLFMLVNGWLIAAYFRESLTVTGSTLVQRRVIGSTVFEFAEITLAKWQCRPGAVSLLLRSRGRRAKIYLRNFTVAEQAELVALLRESIAPGVQQGWNPRLAPSGQPEHARRRAPSAWAPLPIVVMLAALSSLCLYAWNSWGIGLQWAAVGVVLGVAALWYLWRMWRCGSQARLPN